MLKGNSLTLVIKLKIIISNAETESQTVDFKDDDSGLVKHQN